MKIFGIIIEANPLHHGHEYLINEVKKRYQPDLLIGITSTYFNMRGEINCLSKKEKVNELLTSGFDLVFELPIALSLHRADIFAENSIKILKTLGLTHLAFGSEIADLDLLKKVNDYIKSPNYQELFTTELKKQVSFKTALQESLKPAFNNDEIIVISKPNFTLGLFYLNHLSNTSITPVIIKRTSSYNEIIPKSKITSATAIRNLLLENKPINNYVSFNNYLDLVKMQDRLFSIIKYNLLILNKRCQNDTEGIGNYIKKTGNFDLTLVEFINNLANKKYSKTRIRRYLVNLILDNNLDYNPNFVYLRLLGFTKKGKDYLNTLTKDIKNQIFSNPNELQNQEIKPYLDIELKCSKIFEIISNVNNIEEYLFPLRKD